MTEARLKLALVRSEALLAFYSAERRAGATPIEANERMHFYAIRLDALFEDQLEPIREIMGSAS